jgi:lipopolysaccharide transport system permease protein
MRRIRDIVDYRDFLFQYVFQQLAQRYQGSVLGFLWTLLYPILIFCSLALVFSLLNHWNMRDYGIYFFSGYIPWTFFANGAQMSCDSLIANTGYVTRFRVPKVIFPISSVAVNLVDLLSGIGIVFVAMWITGAEFTMALFFLPVSMVIVICFVAGVALLCSMITIFFRDFRPLLSSFLFVWFFFSPVLWKAVALPANARSWFEANPIVPMLALFQYPIWKGQVPPAEMVAMAALIAAITLAAGATVFFWQERRAYYYL